MSDGLTPQALNLMLQIAMVYLARGEENKALYIYDQILKFEELSSTDKGIALLNRATITADCLGHRVFFWRRISIRTDLDVALRHCGACWEAYSSAANVTARVGTPDLTTSYLEVAVVLSPRGKATKWCESRQRLWLESPSQFRLHIAEMRERHGFIPVGRAYLL